MSPLVLWLWHKTIAADVGNDYLSNYAEALLEMDYQFTKTLPGYEEDMDRITTPPPGVLVLEKLVDMPEWEMPAENIYVPAHTVKAQLYRLNSNWR